MSQHDIVRIVLGEAGEMALSAIALGTFLVSLGLWAGYVAGV